MKKIYVIKNDGQQQAYDQAKVISSILRAGVEEKNALEILGRVESQLYDQIPTFQLYQIVGREIVKQKLPQAPRLYQLREALSVMDSFDFEKFIEEILAKEGFQTKWNVIVPGFCIEHQIDVIAQNKKGQLLMVEVKHHHNFHRETDLGTVVELWGRLEDLQRKTDSKARLTNAWLVTNTKFSGHAKKYAQCKNLFLTGWRYTTHDGDPATQEKGLEEMIKSSGLEKVNQMIEKVISHRS